MKQLPFTATPFLLDLRQRLADWRFDSDAEMIEHIVHTNTGSLPGELSVDIFEWICYNH